MPAESDLSKPIIHECDDCGATNPDTMTEFEFIDFCSKLHEMADSIEEGMICLYANQESSPKLGSDSLTIYSMLKTISSAYAFLGCELGKDIDTSFAMISGNKPATLTAPSSTPTNVSLDEGDTHIERYDDCLVFWTYDGTDWVLNYTYGANVSTHSDQSGANYTNGIVPISPPPSPGPGDTLIEQYDNGTAFWTYDGTTWVKDWFDKKCCRVRVEIPDSAFADPDEPTAAEVSAWMTANNVEYPALVYQVGDGTPGNPDAVWSVDNSGNVTNLENEDGCCPEPVVIPDTAFADPSTPTLAEINTWLTANNIDAPALLYLEGEGTAADPDWVWDLSANGVITNIESPSAGGYICGDAMPADIAEGGGAATPAPLCTSVVSGIEDEDSRVTVDALCKTLNIHRTLHTTGSLHTGSVGPDDLLVSGMDSDQADTGTVSTNHDNVVVGVGASAASGSFTGVYSGDRNVVSGTASSISAGTLNTNSGVRSHIGGGLRVNVTGNTSGASGGQDITISAGFGAGTVGGDRNTVTGNRSVEAAGALNVHNGIDGFGGGGLRNTIDGNTSGSINGWDNTIAAARATAIASQNDTIAAGSDNSATLGTRDNNITGGGQANAVVGGGVNTLNGRDQAAVAHLRSTIDANSSAAVGGTDAELLSTGSRNVTLGGEGVQTAEFDQVAMGYYNDSYQGEATADKAFLMGNGADDANRANSHNLLRTGEHYMADNTTVPANIDNSMGRMYVENGALKYESPGGTVTTLGAA